MNTSWREQGIRTTSVRIVKHSEVQNRAPDSVGMPSVEAVKLLFRDDSPAASWLHSKSVSRHRTKIQTTRDQLVTINHDENATRIPLDIVAFVLCLRRLKKNRRGTDSNAPRKLELALNAEKHHREKVTPIVRQRFVERCVLLVRYIHDTELHRLMTLPPSSPLFTLMSHKTLTFAPTTIREYHSHHSWLDDTSNMCVQTEREAVLKQHGRGRSYSYSPSAPNSY